MSYKISIFYRKWLKVGLFPLKVFFSIGTSFSKRKNSWRPHKISIKISSKMDDPVIMSVSVIVSLVWKVEKVKKNDLGKDISYITNDNNTLCPHVS